MKIFKRFKEWLFPKRPFKDFHCPEYIETTNRYGRGGITCLCEINKTLDNIIEKKYVGENKEKRMGHGDIRT